MRTHAKIPTGIEPLAVVQNLRNEAKQILAQLPVAIFFLLMLLLSALLCTGIEYTLLFEVNDYFFGSDLETDPIPAQVIIQSLASIAMIVGFHVLLDHGKTHPIAIAMRGMAKTMIPLYFICIFCVFFYHGLTMADDGSAAIGGLIETETSFLATLAEFLEPYIHIIFSLALGGVIFVTLAVADALICRIREMLPDIVSRVHKARQILKRADTFSAHVEELIDVKARKKELSAIPIEKLALQAAAQINKSIQAPLRTYKKLNFEMSSMSTDDGELPPTEVTHLPHPLPKPEAIQSFIDDCEALVEKLPELSLEAISPQHSIITKENDNE